MTEWMEQKVTTELISLRRSGANIPGAFLKSMSVNCLHSKFQNWEVP